MGFFVLLILDIKHLLIDFVLQTKRTFYHFHTMIKYIQITTGFLLMASVSYGQDYSGDAFRYSEQPISGTARFQGLGGNHASIGGDASNAWGNAAGLAFYNRSELSISPSLRLLNNSANYLGQTTSSSKSNPFIGSASVIFAGMPSDSRSRGPRRTVWGISYSRQASLGNEFVAQGQNNRSSVVNSYIENANGTSPTNLRGQYDSPNFTAYPNTYSDGYTVTGLTAAAYQNYLINDSSTDSTQYFRYDSGVPVSQRVSFSASGAVSQWGLSVASNFSDKFYIGGTLALSHSKYNYTSIIQEQYIGGRVFNGMRENTDYSVTGNGLNLSLGAIYRIDQNLQLGANIVTPTWSTSSYKETTNQSQTIDPIGIPQLDNSGRPVFFVPDNKTITVAPNDFDFRVTTPLRLSGGVTYFIGKSGFLTATAEYVNYSGMRVGTNYYTAGADNQAFKKDQTSYVQGIYQNTVNFRVGGEFRSGIFRARVGGAYLPSAYKSSFDELARNGDRNTLLYSAGLGVRNDRFFADLSGVFYTTKTSYTPYYLNNSTDYASALLTNKNMNFTLSLGTFF